MGVDRVTQEGWVVVADSDPIRRATLGGLVLRLGVLPRPVSTGAEALAAVNRQAPALVLLEQGLEEPSAYEVCRAMRQTHGEQLPIAIIAGDGAERRDEIAALMLGADDFFAEPLDEERLLARLRRLLARSPAPSAQASLTRREHEVLALLVEGRRTVEIADTLCITRKTAATHIEHILSKLGAHSQAQAVAYALGGRTR